jgi:hypothetical protein
VIIRRVLRRGRKKRRRGNWEIGGGRNEKLTQRSIGLLPILLPIIPDIIFFLSSSGLKERKFFLSSGQTVFEKSFEASSGHPYKRLFI